MLNDIGLPREVAPVQREHVAVDVNDNRVPPAIPRPLAGDHQMARRNLVPAARQSRRCIFASGATGTIGSAVSACRGYYPGERRVKVFLDRRYEPVAVGVLTTCNFYKFILCPRQAFEFSECQGHMQTN
jgi:hypothetical protein